MFYTGKEYKDVFDLDSGAYFYLRKKGNESYSTLEPYQKSCRSYNRVSQRTPIRVVAIRKKDGTRFSDEILKEQLVKLLQGGLTVSGTTTVAEIQTASIDSGEIFSQEVRGVPYDEKRFLDFSVVAIDLIVTSQYVTDCLEPCVTSDSPMTIYFGNSTDAALNAAGVQTLEQKQRTNFLTTYEYASGSGVYKYVAFPTSFGTPAAFLNVDSQFPVVMQAAYTVTIGSTQYTVYRSLNQLNGALTMQIT